MLIKDIEMALTLAESKGWKPGGESISRNALIHLLRRLEKTTTELRILQLGSSQTVFVWEALRSLDLLPVEVIVIEHDPIRASQLLTNTTSMTGITLNWNSLKQVTDGECEQLFSEPAEASERWGTIGKSVPLNQYQHYTIRNTFYGEAHQIPLLHNKIDVLIVDGPHGNGRSFAFPIFSSLLKKDALVLIDDFDHYPFAADLERIFSFDEIYKDVWEDQHWLLVRLTGGKIEAKAMLQQ
ncbi:MAG: hypothetical protein P0Y55_07345 [Candidatus Cohnella colombiensis]|uniref:Uncharacterized protein n=1 Tax=Candidatus Cohnella colombiensis TaxID=3121368 RepID=A0AA95JD23_9BACL|nr:MAG: hypothetical protein P0Y55_07345 [Cohnella sp.]